MKIEDEKRVLQNKTNFMNKIFYIHAADLVKFDLKLKIRISNAIGSWAVTIDSRKKPIQYQCVNRLIVYQLFSTTNGNWSVIY